VASVIRWVCKALIGRGSDGGSGRDPSERGSSLYLKPDMASLSTGSVNFPTIVYQNHTVLVRDLATKMRDNGIRPEITLAQAGGFARATPICRTTSTRSRTNVAGMLTLCRVICNR
jgi:hypothetical protein